MSNKPVVVLDRCDENPDPDYCIHGRASCVFCGFFCWLGSESVGPVSRHDYWPICVSCAQQHIPPEYQSPIGNLNDHKRADGPHV